MTKLLIAVGLFGVLAIAGAADRPVNASVPAADTPQSPAEYVIVTGEVNAVDLPAMSFNLVVGNNEERAAIKITDQTRFVYNGEPSDAQTVLQVGSQVAVRHVDGQALAVSHRSLESPE